VQALPSVREIFDMFEATLLASATPEVAASAGAP
jgi:hypothetical protein